MSALASSRWLAVGATTLAFPGLLLAHPQGHLIYDCAAGLAHPWHGWDHLLALLAVGGWAAQQRGAARLALPGAFVGGTALGALAGTWSGPWVGLEAMLALSVLVTGGLLAGAVQAGRWSGSLLVGGFALCHGFAHGVEAPAFAAGGYLAGLLLATISLLAVAYFAGRHLAGRSPLLPRVVGAACVLAGMLLLPL